MEQSFATGAAAAPAAAAPAREAAAWERPSYQVISLDCEITAYAPDDGGEPLF